MGIDMNSLIEYKVASLRFFGKHEHHVSRVCHDYVLLMVYDGVLRFNEDGADYEISSGEYFIQRANGIQRGDIASDEPKYLYVHFGAKETGDASSLERRGEFDYTKLKSKMERLDAYEKSGKSLTEKSAVFYSILSELYRKYEEPSLADEIAEFISENFKTELSLDDIAKEFNFSKNHIINIFKKEFGKTPFEYMNFVRIRAAKMLLEVTSDSLENIAYSCGYSCYSNFYKRFLSETGCSPTVWRNRIRLSPVGIDITVKNPSDG